MASPGSNDGGASAAAAVCCMCGDHGLPGELFQCGVCLQRLQHRYCSNLYPRVAAYRSCNWCLRDEETGGGSPVEAPAAMAKQRALSRPTDSRDHDGKDDRPSGGSGGGCSRSAFPAEPGKAVKKPKKNHERAALLRPVATTKAVKGRKVQDSARKPAFRMKKARVQRYKLLAEVIISC
ncbi:hypothetical protein BAE44_0015759 [Dichanthelium oligosanthes]|uniref:PHD-type zinc finger plants domain-containing protein n=1 Tax=Dichanthelium oligosanthes TaxID=888268 RepID=A0A1E5VDJ6_9POAL|nr:hypothetical protein BAE44_0015759 [Dichanthelium oligosanthes]